jgi:hypothetical protein
MNSPRFASSLVSSLLASAMAIGMIASSPQALAQDETALAKATIPFAFQSGSQVMPAGTYTITTQSDHVLVLRDPSQKAAEFVLVHPAYQHQAPKNSVIVFDRRGDQYFLRNIWIANNTTGMECTKTRAEKLAERQLEASNNKPSSDTITLALNTSPQR